MESVEVSAKTVDEAIDIALQELGLKRSEVEIEILTAGKSGIFGLGGELARVRVTAKVDIQLQPVSEDQAVPEIALRARIEVADLHSPPVEGAIEYLRRLLEMMDVEAAVTARSPETPGDGLGRASAVLDIEGDDVALLIGRRGTTLAALQYLVNLMANHQSESEVLFTIDVERYRRRREESLTGLARRMADRVKQTGRAITLEPMPPAERRIVHMALADYSGIATRSIGEGETRKVVIQPRRSARASG